MDIKSTLEIPESTKTSDLYSHKRTILYRYLKILREDSYFSKLKFFNKTFKFDISDFGKMETIFVNRNVVLSAQYIPIKLNVAIKKLPIPYGKYLSKKRIVEIKRIQKIIKVNKKLCFSHNVATFYGFGINEWDLYFCMELMDMSLKDLYSKIHDKFNYFPEDLLVYVLECILNALVDLQQEGIIHQDINPDNILVNCTGEIKLCGFGCSKILGENDQDEIKYGSILYWSPERFELNLKQHDSRSDIWSLGITISELLLGRHPIKEPLNSYVKIEQYTCGVNYNDNIINQCFESNNNKYIVVPEILGSCLRVYQNRPTCLELIKRLKFCKNFDDPENIARKYLKDIDLGELKRSMLNKDSHSFLFHFDDSESQLNWVVINKIRYNLNEKIGRGRYGKVYRGEFNTRSVAVKVIDLFIIFGKDIETKKKDNNFMDNIYKELREISNQIKSDEEEHIVRLYHYEVDLAQNKVYLALQLCLGTLEDFLSEETFMMDLITVKPCLKSLLIGATLGVYFLHSKKILHRDISPHNILISMPKQSGSVIALISDFGHAKELEEGLSKTVLSRVVGTKGWSSPEIVTWEKSFDDRAKLMIGNKSDIFSLGLVFAYSLSFDLPSKIGQHPFGNKSDERDNNIYKYANGNFDYDISFAKDINEDTNLLTAMLMKDEDRRPKARAILEHPFFWSNERRYSYIKSANNFLRSTNIIQETATFRKDLELNKPYVDWIHPMKHNSTTKPFENFVINSKRAKYDGNKLEDLLRAIRNLKEHEEEVTQVDPSLKSFTIDYCKKVVEAFPQLLMYLYKQFYYEVVKNKNSWQSYSDDKQDLFKGMEEFYVAGEDSEVFC